MMKQRGRWPARRARSRRAACWSRHRARRPSLAAVAPVTLQNRRAAVCHAVNFRAGGLAVIGYDHGQHRGREAEHHLVDDSRHDKIKHDTVNNGIDILEHRTVEQDDRQRRRKRDVAERQVRMPCLDAHGE